MNPKSKVAIVTGASSGIEIRASMNRVIEKVMASGDEPSVVGATVLKVATASSPRLRYTSGGLAARLRLLRRFAPAGLLDAGLRKDLQLDVQQAIA